MAKRMEAHNLPLVFKPVKSLYEMSLCLSIPASPHIQKQKDNMAPKNYPTPIKRHFPSRRNAISDLILLYSILFYYYFL